MDGWVEDRGKYFLAFFIVVEPMLTNSFIYFPLMVNI